MARSWVADWSKGSPPEDWAPVTLDADIANCSGLYITGAGNVSFYTRASPAVARTMSVPANFFLPGIITRVLTSGTTATGLFAAVDQ